MGKSISTKMLISEPPLQVLPSLAQEVGLNGAIVLQQIHYWISKSPHEKDGFNWIYNTYEQWTEQFPFWSERTIQRIFTTLENSGYIISQMFDKSDGNRRKYYRINYDQAKIEYKTTPPMTTSWHYDDDKLAPSIIDTENNNIYIYTQIYEHWNQKHIWEHRLFTEKMKRAINGKLKDKYTVEDIIKSIDNYDKILKSDDYYFKYKWTLQDFLQRGFEKFLDWNNAHDNYLKDKYKSSDDKTIDFNWVGNDFVVWEGKKEIFRVDADHEEDAAKFLQSKGINYLAKPKINPGETFYKPPTYEERLEKIRKGEIKEWDF